MSGLLDDIQTLNTHARPNGCVVARVMQELSDADQADLEAALADPGVMHVAIARALINRGHDVGAHGKSIASHRKGQCGCARG